jgi:hypothetical protein
MSLRSARPPRADAVNRAALLARTTSLRAFLLALAAPAALATVACGPGLSQVEAGCAHAIAESPEETAMAAEAHAMLVQAPVAAVAGPFPLLFGRGDTPS